MKNTSYSAEEISNIVKENYSIAECLRALNLRPAGGNYKWLNKIIKLNNLDTSHFTGQGWNKGKKLGLSKKAIPLSEILIENSNYVSTNSLRKRLLKEGIKPPVCECCNNDTWNNKPIPLELDHKNGVNTDHRLENLQLLCPNCHAQTPHYRGKNKLSALNERREVDRVKFGETLTDNADDNPEPSSVKRKGVETLRRGPKLCSCGEPIRFQSKRCRKCDVADRKTVRPSPFQLLRDFEELKSFVQVGKKYGVRDNSVRKWCKTYQIDDNMVKRKSSAQSGSVAKATV